VDHYPDDIALRRNLDLGNVIVGGELHPSPLNRRIGLISVDRL
jgi:hypothetical protein